MWLSRQNAVTVLPLLRFTESDQQRILQMSASVPVPSPKLEPEPEPVVMTQEAPAATPDPVATLQPKATLTAETQAAMPSGQPDVWRLISGETVEGRFITVEHDAVWLSSSRGTTCIMLDDLTTEEWGRAYELHSELQHAGSPLPRMDPARLPASVRPQSHEVESASSNITNQRAACSSCGKPADIKPGERCPHCGVQKHWSRQLRIGEAPTQFGSTPGPVGSSGDSQIRISTRGLVRLAILVVVVLGSGIAGFLKLVFGSTSAKRQG